jgi:hypothetical protein
MAFAIHGCSHADQFGAPFKYDETHVTVLSVSLSKLVIKDWRYWRPYAPLAVGGVRHSLREGPATMRPLDGEETDVVVVGNVVVVVVEEESSEDTEDFAVALEAPSAAPDGDKGFDKTRLKPSVVTTRIPRTTRRSAEDTLSLDCRSRVNIDSVTG